MVPNLQAPSALSQYLLIIDYRILSRMQRHFLKQTRICSLVLGFLGLLIFQPFNWIYSSLMQSTRYFVIYCSCVYSYPFCCCFYFYYLSLLSATLAFPWDSTHPQSPDASLLHSLLFCTSLQGFRSVLLVLNFSDNTLQAPTLLCQDQKPFPCSRSQGPRFLTWLFQDCLVILQAHLTCHLSAGPSLVSFLMS